MGAWEQDDLRTGVNARIDDLRADRNARFEQMNARLTRVKTQLAELWEDLREIRTLLQEALKAKAP